MQIGKDVASKVSGLLATSTGTLAPHIGIEYLVLERGRVVARMPVDGRTKQPFGLLHGGASVALAESLASIGAWLMVDERKFDVVGMEINANHLRAVREGYVTGEALPLHQGGKTQVWEIRIRDSEGKLSCISRCTLAVVEKR